jgi:hypothetical protein
MKRKHASCNPFYGFLNFFSLSLSFLSFVRSLDVHTTYMTLSFFTCQLYDVVFFDLSRIGYIPYIGILTCVYISVCVFHFSVGFHPFGYHLFGPVVGVCFCFFAFVHFYLFSGLYPIHHGVSRTPSVSTV